MIDIHTHILSGVDDGSKDVSESIQMLYKCKNSGIDTVNLTPHFYAECEYPDTFIKKRDESLSLLIETCKDKTGLPKIMIGAEVLFFKGISIIDKLHDLTIKGTNILLLEMPFFQWVPSTIDEVINLYTKRGITPLIAHIDRYLYRQNKRFIYELVSHPDILIQANAEFFINKKTFRKAVNMLRKGQIDLLGSDCHNMNLRNPNLNEAVALIYKKIGNEDLNIINNLENKILAQAYLIELGNSSMEG